jgi:hypothetical protein
MTARPVRVIPHTHWDREWYASFQTFRMKLVDLVDELLDLLERDPAYAHFQLDGQMAAVDDYLEIRPENTERLRALATAGRVSMGPWYALPDEFLVSGETLVRNLQMGFARATEFGGAMPVGYLPDMFGHVAQMPQILRSFGLEHTVVWRGVPRAVDKDAFSWEAPDGSTIRAEYLPDGYGHGAHLPDDAKDFLDRIRAFEGEHGDRLAGPILWMNGTDHLAPQPWLGRVVAEANDLGDGYDIRVSSLADYLAEASAQDSSLPHWRGELRSGARANLLMGVASNRVDVKQAAARAERGLERLAEPLSAFFLPADRWPERLLDEAWTAMARNSAHDSICACSIDEVCDAVLHRFNEATGISEGLTERALDALAGSLASAGAVVFNPSARRRSGLVRLRLPGEGAPDGLQLVSQRPTEATQAATVGDCRRIVQEALNHVEGFYAADVVAGDGGGIDITLHRDLDRTDRVTSGAVLAQIDAIGAANGAPATLTMKRPPVRVVLAHIGDIAGFGWTRWEPEVPAVAVVEVEGTAMDNGIVRVEIDTTTGTFSINGHGALGRLVDGGDSGDTYNYNAPAGDRLVDQPASVEVTAVESGPLRAVLRIDTQYEWPESVIADERTGQRSVDVRSTIELRAGEQLVRVTVAFDNQCRDHRLRAHFPLPKPTTTSRAECAFAVVERGLEAEGGPTERGLATYPSRRFVQAGGLTVVHEGLLEYELVDVADGAASGLALTLLRATGMLSQGPMAYRPMPAGPMTPMDGPQMQGPLEVRYGVSIADTDPFALVDDAFLPLLTVDAPGGGTAADSGQVFSVEGAEVSAVVREAGQLRVRVFNPSPERTTVRFEGRRGQLIDLLGRPENPFEDQFDLGPWQIATAQLSD